MIRIADRGVKLAPKKEYSDVNWVILPARIPARVWMALPKSQSSQMNWVIQPGSKVKTGEVIAVSKKSTSGFRIYASITGEVSKMLHVPHASGASLQAVEIISASRDREEWADFEMQPAADPKTLTREDQLNRLAHLGVLDGTAEENPLYEKMTQRNSKIETLLINACESEPYVTSQTSLVLSHPLEILKAADFFRELTGAKRVIITLEGSRAETAELLRSKIYFLKWTHVEIQLLGVLYPQDHAEIQKKRMIPEPSSGTTFVLSAAALYLAYEAVLRGRPVLEHPLSLAGECFAESRNVWVRNGSVVEDLLKMGKGLLREPSRLLAGGPMRGLAQAHGKLPTASFWSAVLALPPEAVYQTEIAPCIRCGRCLEVCPEALSPAMITMAAEAEDSQTAADFDVKSCIECGNCAYVCPAKRPMLELIRSVK